MGVGGGKPTTYLMNMPYDVLISSTTPAPLAPTTDDRFICVEGSGRHTSEGASIGIAGV